MDKKKDLSIVKKENKVGIGCCIAAGIILCVGMTGAGVGTATYLLPTQPVHLAIQVIAPTTIQAGTDFDLVVRVTNNESSTITVSAIRIPDSVTALASIQSAEPAFMGFQHADGQTTCLFSQPIESGATVPFSLKMRALTDGAMTGALEVIANSQNVSSPLKIAVMIPTTTPMGLPSATPTNPPDLHPFRSVVQIYAYAKNAAGILKAAWSGSGSIITTDGLILTNYHVAIGLGDLKAEKLLIKVAEREDADTTPKFIAEVVEANESLDLAVLRITTDPNGNRLDSTTLNLPALPIGDSTKLKPTDVLYILGYPGVGGNTITLTRGIVSGFLEAAALGDGEWVKTDTTISGGNSGGAVLNDKGQLVGVPTLKITRCLEGQASCIPSGDMINAFRPVHLAIPMIEKAMGKKVIFGDATPTISTTPTKEILFWDDFEGGNARWDQVNNEKGVLEYSQGGYRITAAGADQRMLGRPHLDFADLQMEFSASYAKGAHAIGYGAICRYRDENNYYFFKIGPGMVITIGKVKDGVSATLASQNKIDGILPPPAENLISIQCQGGTLSIGINGIQLINAQDSEWSVGDIAFFVDGGNTGGVEVFFDHLRVYRP
jgi:S1-C subfamily serine protease